MSLRFLADQCVPMSVVRALREEGHEVLVLREHMPPDSADEAVISMAQQVDCILLSLDRDFVDIVAFPPRRYKGIIALQVKNRPGAIPHILERLRQYLSSHPDMRHYAGKLLVVDAHRVRVRE